MYFLYHPLIILDALLVVLKGHWMLLQKEGLLGKGRRGRREGEKKGDGFVFSYLIFSLFLLYNVL